MKGRQVWVSACYATSRTVIDFGLNGFPRSFRKPWGPVQLRRSGGSSFRLWASFARVVSPARQHPDSSRRDSYDPHMCRLRRAFVGEPLTAWRRLLLSRTARRHPIIDAREPPSGYRSMKNVGADAAMRVTPFDLSMSWPASCTIRSRAKRSGLSTTIVRAPLDISRSSTSAKPGRSVTGSAPLNVRVLRA
jgi:hypothetical protein